MKKICVVTTTRADFGVLSPVIKQLHNDTNIDLKILVSGTHLMKNFGYTINEITSCGYKKNIIELPIGKFSSEADIFQKTFKIFNKKLRAIKPDCVIVLGDRYEILAVASVCLLLNIPVAHISGGDVTFGAIDDACRHSITKLSNIHFTGNEDMRKRVIQLGEQPNTVFNVGETGVENILKTQLMSFAEFRQSLNLHNLEEKKYCIVTYHPETLSNISPIDQIKWLLDFLKNNSEFHYIITKANIDCGGEQINQYIKQFVKECKNITFIDSLGFKRYLSGVKYCAMVIGNSSSGIIEVPYFEVPTINIGNRQEGRMQSNSILNCNLLDDKQLNSIFEIAKSKKFLESCKNCKKLYGDGNSSQIIVEKIKEFLDNKPQKKKIFYDLKGVKWDT